MQIEEMLCDKGLSRQISAMVVDALATESERADFKLILRDIGSKSTVTAIKNDDFPALESAATLVGGMLGNTLVAWAPVAIASLVVLLFTYRRKRISLSGNQAVLVLELKRNPNLTVKQLVSGLRSSLTAEQISDGLAGLANASREDGVKVSLVASDAKGRWRLVDV